MPKAIQQTPKPVVSKNGQAQSILDRIGPIRQSKIGRLKCSFYGNPKSGKTRLAATFPKRCLFIGAEDGTASIVGTKNTEFVLLNETSEIYQLIEGPLANGDYATVVIDQATKLRDMRIAELWKAQGLTGSDIPERKPFLFADKQWKAVWTQASNDLKDILRPLLDLPNRVDLNVIIIAQEGALYAEEGAISTDVIKPAVTSAVGKSLALFINAECDYICQTFIRAQTVKSKIPGTDLFEDRKTGKNEFCLRIGPHEIYTTGFRVPLGVKEPPDVIVNPTYDKIVQVIKGEYKG